jgi:phage repressor protein C with HTH and peptisase S24 domain
MSDSTLSDRLRIAMRAKGFTQYRLADEVGVSQGAIQKIVSGKAKSTTKIVEISKALGVTPEWLLGQTGNDSLPQERNEGLPPVTQWGEAEGWDSHSPLANDEVEVPFLKDIEFACGDGSYGDDDYNGFKLRFAKSTLRRVGANSDGSGVLCFPATGNSMEPYIPEGATVAINTIDKKIIDGKVYAINQDGWKRLKILYRVGPNTVSIRSYNSEEHQPEDVPLDRIEIIGRMFWTGILW